MYLVSSFRIFPLARPSNELKVKEWISIGKIETDFEPNEEDSAPGFAFNNLAFEHKFSVGVCENNKPTLHSKKKIYIIFKLGVKIIFQISHTQLIVWCCETRYEY